MKSTPPNPAPSNTHHLTPKRYRPALLLALLLSAGAANAELNALFVVDPSDRRDGLMLSRTALEDKLSKHLSQPVKVKASEDSTDAMRATRSGAPDLIIAPAQVIASALAHGYQLVGSTDPDEQYLLITKSDVSKVSALRTSGRVYLPQQDSVYTYLARGMLTAEALSFRDLKEVKFGRYPEAGRAALALGLTDATVMRENEWKAWSANLPAGKFHKLASSGVVPGGLSVAIKATIQADIRAKAVRWFESGAAGASLKPTKFRSQSANYQRVAELGTFTPTALSGATVVKAADVKRLQTEGAVLVDTRTPAEFERQTITGALFHPYLEKSLKDVAYEASQDSFTGLEKLDKTKPTVFFCNGAECWKSYKASRAALSAGFKQVYWFRGGVPEWQKGQ